MENIFSGLEELGFKNLDNVDLYKKEANEEKNGQNKEKKAPNPKDFLYEKTCQCPVCNNEFKTKAVKKGKARIVSTDTDLMPIYENINPTFYDVIICPRCGYSALTRYFEKVKADQADLIKTKISSSYKAKIYPDVYDIDIAIERYKLALLNAFVKVAKSSEKAYICLKLGWLYRLKKDNANEIKFLEQAYIGFNDSFSTESFPICGMDSYTLMFLVGELARRLGKENDALIWLGRVITGRNVNPKLKERARDQKDLIKNSI